MRFNKFLSVVLILLISLNVFTAYADSSVPFQLVESTPENSAVDIELNVEIKLLFNKNVVNFSVKDNNANCIKLYDEGGQAVSAELIFPDDQVEPEKKREIYIKPTELNENTKYTIEISKDMLAKNGSTLGETVFVSFTTLSVNSEEPEVKPITEEPVTAENEKVINEELTKTDTSDNEDVEAEDIEATEPLENAEKKSETTESEAYNENPSHEQVAGNEASSNKPVSDNLSSDIENVQEDEAESAETAAKVNGSEVKNASSNNGLMVTGAIAAIVIAAIAIIFKMRRA